MAVVLQVEFEMNGPFGDEMTDQFADLKDMGVPELRAKIFDINDSLTNITNGLVE